MNEGSGMSNILLCSGLVLSAIVVLIGFGFLRRWKLNEGSGMANVLLWSGLVLSAIAVLIGFGLLINAIGWLAGMIRGYYDFYEMVLTVGTFCFGLVLLVPGILGLRACIRRLKGVGGEQPGA